MGCPQFALVFLTMIRKLARRYYPTMYPRIEVRDCIVDPHDTAVETHHRRQDTNSLTRTI